MRLINIDPIVTKFNNCECYSECEDYDSGVDDGMRYILNAIEESPTIDPIHAAGGCYCKECLHSEPVEYKFADDWVVPIDEYWCNEHKITMPLNGFCSEGRKDDTKNA